MAFPLQILLIDDDADDLDIFNWVLRSIDPSLMADHAADGFEALARLNDDGYAPDLIFLDLNMPRMHGLDCLRQIRQIGRLDQKPVIVYSTSSNPSDIVECRVAGASDYIVKGSELSVIKQELLQVLKKHKLSVTR